MIKWCFKKGNNLKSNFLNFLKIILLTSLIYFPFIANANSNLTEKLYSSFYNEKWDKTSKLINKILKESPDRKELSRYLDFFYIAGSTAIEYGDKKTLHNILQFIVEEGTKAIDVDPKNKKSEQFFHYFSLLTLKEKTFLSSRKSEFWSKNKLILTQSLTSKVFFKN